MRDEGELCIIDPETNERRPVDRQLIEQCLAEYHEILIFLADLENGIITMNLDDYKRLPAVIMDLRRIFRQIRMEETCPK